MLQTAAAPIRAEAAKAGLVKSGKKIYYYQNGQKLKNSWKKVGKNKYYFDKNGAAYVAPKVSGMSKNVVCKKIGGARYCFDRSGHMVKNGVYADKAEKAYIVSKNGKVDETKTKKLQKALKYLTDAKTARKLLGKPKKTETSDSCLYDGGTDLLLTYPNMILSLSRETNGKEHVLYLEPR